MDLGLEGSWTWTPPIQQNGKIVDGNGAVLRTATSRPCGTRCRQRREVALPGPTALFHLTLRLRWFLLRWLKCFSLGWMGKIHDLRIHVTGWEVFHGGLFRAVAFVGVRMGFDCLMLLRTKNPDIFLQLWWATTQNHEPSPQNDTNIKGLCFHYLNMTSSDLPSFQHFTSSLAPFHPSPDPSHPPWFYLWRHLSRGRPVSNVSASQKNKPPKPSLAPNPTVTLTSKKQECYSKPTTPMTKVWNPTGDASNKTCVGGEGSVGRRAKVKPSPLALRNTPKHRWGNPTSPSRHGRWFIETIYSIDYPSTKRSLCGTSTIESL